MTFLSSDDPRVVSMWPHLVHGLSVHDEDGAHTHVLWAPRPRTEMIINIISAMYGVMKKNALPVLVHPTTDESDCMVSTSYSHGQSDYNKCNYNY